MEGRVGLKVHQEMAAKVHKLVGTWFLAINLSTRDGSMPQGEAFTKGPAASYLKRVHTMQTSQPSVFIPCTSCVCSQRIAGQPACDNCCQDLRRDSVIMIYMHWSYDSSFLYQECKGNFSWPLVLVWDLLSVAMSATLTQLICPLVDSHAAALVSSSVPGHESSI